MGHTSHVDLSTCCLEYYDSDDTTKPNLIILGPAPCDIRDFDQIKPTLERKFRVLILQYPGFIGSTFEQPGETGEGGVLYLFQVLLEFLETLNLQGNMVMGIGMGAYLACKLAIEYSDLVTKLCLVSPLGFTPPGLLARHYITLMSGRFAPNPLAAAKAYTGHKERVSRRITFYHRTTNSRLLSRLWRQCWNEPLQCKARQLQSM